MAAMARHATAALVFLTVTLASCAYAAHKPNIIILFADGERLATTADATVLSG